MTTRQDLGPPLEYSDDELTQLSQVTAADARAARVLWRRDCPPALRELLDAQPAAADA